jgi:hypothetical protein
LSSASKEAQALKEGLFVVLPKAQLSDLSEEYHFAELRNIH